MLRQEISVVLEGHYKMIEELEGKRAALYGHLPYNLARKESGYMNLTNSIIFYEGRVEEARGILTIIDDIELRVHADKCEHCNHHEIGVVDHKGKFRAVKPGEKIMVRRNYAL